MTVMTRRTFLKTTTALSALTLWPAWMPRLAFAPAQMSPRGDVLVCIFLRGAADALNIVVPHGDPFYYQTRPTLAIPRPDDTQVEKRLRTIETGDFFGFHPALRPLLPMWQAGHLAAVHAVGSPDESRSHFKAMALMEQGVAVEGGPASGWLGRHLASLNTGNQSPLRGISIGERVMPSLRGPIPTTALRSIIDFHLGGDPQAIAAMQATLATFYGAGDPLDPPAHEALETMQVINRLDPISYRPTGAADYPDDEFGLGLKQVAMLIKAEVGLEVACLDIGDWDTHIAQGGSEGLMANHLDQLARGLNAFYLDLADQADHLSVIVMSEFGRRLKENGGLGTDHGHGSLMLLLGGHIDGGKVHGNWPGLAPEQLVGPGDLAVTTDYRDILAEILSRRLNNDHLDLIFPGYQPAFRNVTRI